MSAEKIIHVVSWLDSELDEQLSASMADPQVQWRRPEYRVTIEELLHRKTSLPMALAESDLQQADLVLLPIDDSTIDALNLWQQGRADWMPLWAHIPAAMVAVMTDSVLAHAVSIAHLDFDAILLAPFEPEDVQLRLQQAQVRHSRRCDQQHRYQRMRSLCRQVNQKRRSLRDKVDLLCQNLVEANSQLAGTLQDLRRAYDMQTDLVGEYDQIYMLHKALRRMRASVPEVNAAVFACRDDAFLAHLTGYWDDEPGFLPHLEDALQMTIVAEVMVQRKPVVVADAGQCQHFSKPQRKALADTSLAGMPLVIQDEIVGVLVFYRAASRPLCTSDLQNIQSSTIPLARAMVALYKLEPLIG